MCPIDFSDLISKKFLHMFGRHALALALLYLVSSLTNIGQSVIDVDHHTKISHEAIQSINFTF
jgi:hypothetical protein